MVRATGPHKGRGIWVFHEIIRQITTDYPGLPDPREMDVDELIWWYDGLRDSLKAHYKNVNKK